MPKPANSVVAVAASGGRDSTALLHATARAAGGQGVEVVALHVHHGLNPLADHWLDHVRRQCARWARAGLPVRFECRRLQGAPSAGESVEAWARKGRYRALAEMAHGAGASLILLAHHQQDQAETVLLQALRGAGPAGLAAMPQDIEREAIRWCRPWLALGPGAIQTYVRRHHLAHIEDGSNRDTRFDRNRLRHEVWPALVAAFPQAPVALAAVARQAKSAAALIDEVAAADLAALGADGDLPLAGWRRLSPARQRFVLRYWLHLHLQDGAPEPLLERLLAELHTSRPGRWPVDGTRELRAYRGALSLGATPHGMRAPKAVPASILHPGMNELPAWGGRMEMRAVGQGGVVPAVLAAAMLRPRQAGDDFQFEPRSQARSLKKQFQAAAVPAWSRGGPVVASTHQTLYVPGLGMDARCWAPPGELQWRLDWHPDPP
jgi:tRNA(Ile)-lysidine synthase